MDETMSGEAMVLNIIHKINKLKFLYCKKDFLTLGLKSLPCNAITLPNAIIHVQFEYLNWLPVTYRFKQCVISTVFKYFNKQCPNYLHKVFDTAK